MRIQNRLEYNFKVVICRTTSENQHTEYTHKSTFENQFFYVSSFDVCPPRLLSTY